MYYKTIRGDDLKKKLFYTFLVKYLGPDRNDVYNIAKTLTDIYSQVRIIVLSQCGTGNWLKREGTIKGVALSMNDGSWLHFKMATASGDRKKCLKLAALP